MNTPKTRTPARTSTRTLKEPEEGSKGVSEIFGTSGGDRGGKRYWLIRKLTRKGSDFHEPPHTRTLAVGGKLAVFSFREEAESFLDNRVESAGWRIEKHSTGELVALLCGPLSAFRNVALDPIPETPEESGVDGLLRVTREEFVWMICEADIRG